MFKRKLTISDFFLIAVNLVPVFGVWFEGWDAKKVFIVYCMETVIVGLVNILKMTGITLFVQAKHQWNEGDNSTMVNGFYFILFFMVHYGFFVFVQTQIFFAATDLNNSAIGFGIYSKIPGMLGPEGRLLILIFIVYYTVQGLFSFFGGGEYKRTSMSTVMFEPYIRIFVQQFIVILGGMMLAFKAYNLFILLVAGVKIIAEVALNGKNFMQEAGKMQKIREEREKKNLKI